MRTLAIDLETYSEVDITKAGLYKYAENSEILLFAYAFDDEEVQIVDMARGEKLPLEVGKALFDPSVIKTAFNAAFEIHVINNWIEHQRGSEFLLEEEKKMKYSEWRCTMIAAWTLGLSGTLEKVGKMLNLSEDKQKMSVGKQLIRYFSKPCAPTKANGGRIRNLPEHNPEKWELFKEYCKRDVEVERTIRKRLEKFPQDEREHRLWQLDQKINDEGVLVDWQLVESAIDIDEKFKTETMSLAVRLTGLANPNSNSQVLDWFEEREGFRPKSLDAESREELKEQVSESTKRVLELKDLLGKSSVKKYVAMKNARCNDNRVHGMLQFYGAARTGRWCLTGDHEVLTKDGWIRLDDWDGGNIAVWNASSEAVSFQPSKALCFDYSGKMYRYKDVRIDQYSTPDHKMRARRRYNADWQDLTVEEMSRCRPLIPINGYRYNRGCASPAWLRVLIMTQADGHYTLDGGVNFHFKKERKIERCKMLLRKAEITFAVNTFKDSTKICIPARCVPLWLRQFRTKTFGFWLLDENPDVFFDELPYWDGYYPAPNSIQYSTCNKQNADIVQALAHMSGRAASIKFKHRNIEKHPNWKQSYVVDIWLSPKNNHEIKSKPEVSFFEGKVYCAETPTGYFLVRRNGKVWITGNSGRLVQLQNLPQNHLEDLADARDLVKSNDFQTISLLYDSPPDVLSQLIRTAFIAPKGKRFIVADFSAIEARVIAWIADEKWRMETFAKGGDIYCASASAMFHVPVVKHGENGHLRAKGKIAELACGYGGGINALKAFDADKMGLTEEDMDGIVKQWREASPNIPKLWRVLEKCFRQALELKSKVTYQKGIEFSYEKGIMFMTLPSGRRIAYPKPKIKYEAEFNRESITYEGTTITGVWGRNYTWGGKLTENLIQATARDCLAEAMLKLDAAGYKIVMHVHDEVILETPIGEGSLDEVCSIMGEPLSWAKGLVLTADGYETDEAANYYRKD